MAEQTAQELDLIQRMYDREIAPLIEVTRAKKAHSDAQNKLSEAITTTEKERATDYSKTQGELASLRQKRRLSQDQLSRTTLLAPLRGVVNKLSVTTIGGVLDTLFMGGDRTIRIVGEGDADNSQNLVEVLMPEQPLRVYSVFSRKNGNQYLPRYERALREVQAQQPYAEFFDAFNED